MAPIESKLTLDVLITSAFQEGNGRMSFGKTKDKRDEEAGKLKEWFKTKYGNERKREPEKKKIQPTGNPLDLTLGFIVKNPDVFIADIKKGIRMLLNDKHLYAYKVEYLLRYLNEKYSADIDTGFLAYIKWSDKEQRYLEELKYLHAKGKTRGDIAETFCISERLFDDDVSAIKDGFKFMGTEIKNVKLSISDREYSSPVHPVFLALNSAQIYALTIGMKLLSKGTIFEHALSPVSDEIYAQLTEYARNLIDCQPEAKDLIFDKYKRKFVSSLELMYSSNDQPYCQYIKSQKPCKVSYFAGSDEIRSITGTIHLPPESQIRFNQILVRNDEKELLLNISDVQHILEIL